MKGRDALIVEMMEGARRYGLEKAVIQSIPHPSGSESFDALVERVLTALVKHSQRRAAELRDASSLLKNVGVLPTMTDAAAERLDGFEASQTHNPT
jgi:hypothetical protein